MKMRLQLAAALWSLCLALPAATAVAQPQPADVVTVGTVSGSGTVDVPVYIRDVSGTPLGIDQPAGSRIQSWSIKVDYAAAASVQSITFTRAGITTPLTPTFESSPSAAGTVSLIDTFDEAINLVPFTSNAPAGQPGRPPAGPHRARHRAGDGDHADARPDADAADRRGRLARDA